MNPSRKDLVKNINYCNPEEDFHSWKNLWPGKGKFDAPWLSQRSQCLSLTNQQQLAMLDNQGPGRGPNHCGGFCQLGRFGRAKGGRLPKKPIKAWPNFCLFVCFCVGGGGFPPHTLLVNAIDLHLLLMYYWVSQLLNSIFINYNNNT